MIPGKTTRLKNKTTFHEYFIPKSSFKSLKNVSVFCQNTRIKSNQQAGGKKQVPP